MNDALGDRMKLYEGAEADRRFMPLLPVMARLDGRAFHSYTRGLERPFDTRFIALMQSVCWQLMIETNACMGYVQSDEISLTWYSDSIKSQIFFDGRIMKMTSILASIASTWFNQLSEHHLGAAYGPSNKHAHFDCRVWQVPNLIEGANVFVWREQDATRNSIQMLAQSLFSHNELQGLSCDELQDKMFKEMSVNWNDLPIEQKRGTYYQRKKIMRPFTHAELDKLPPKHEAHRNPKLVVERTQVTSLQMPVLSRVINRVDVIYHGAEPMLASDGTS